MKGGGGGKEALSFLLTFPLFRSSSSPAHSLLGGSGDSGHERHKLQKTNWTVDPSQSHLQPSRATLCPEDFRQS